MISETASTYKMAKSQIATYSICYLLKSFLQALFKQTYLIAVRLVLWSYLCTFLVADPQAGHSGLLFRMLIDLGGLFFPCPQHPILHL